MKIAIIGLTGSGKSSLFSTCTGTEIKEHAQSRAQVGVVEVPDERLERLSKMFNPKKTVFTTIDFIDSFPLDTKIKQDKIALYDTLKTADALVCVLGGYKLNSPQELADELEKIRLEISVSDLDIALKRSERLEKDIKLLKNKGDKQKELDLFKKIIPVLENGEFLNKVEFDSDELQIMSNLSLLSRKPLIYVVNSGEDKELNEKSRVALEKILKDNRDESPLIFINCSLESEIALLSPEDKALFLEEYGLKESGRDLVIKAAYASLNLITFFTVGEDECRTWKIPAGSTAVDAAGSIHSDLARGFIRAEVMEAEQLLEAGSIQELKKIGKVRLEGKTYPVKDGDIIHVMFNI